MTTTAVLKMRLGFIAVLCLALAGCAETYSWHQKMTVVITTPDGERVGSSVGKAVWRDGTGPSEMGMGQAGFVGEAVVVPLPDNRYLFALLRNAATLAQYAVHDDAMRKKSFSERASSLQIVGQSGFLPKAHYPMLVTFDDINDPTSVKLIDPEDLDAVFGCPANQRNGQEYPWRQQGLSWRKWNEIQAFRLSELDAAKVSGVPEDMGRYHALKALNHWFNREGFRTKDVNSNTPASRFPLPPELRATVEELEALYRRLSKRYGEKKIKTMRRTLYKTSSRLKYEYLQRSRDTSEVCYRIKDIAMQISDEPPTVGGVERILSWFGNKKILNGLWKDLSSQQRSILNRGNWKRGL